MAGGRESAIPTAPLAFSLGFTATRSGSSLLTPSVQDLYVPKSLGDSETASLDNFIPRAHRVDEHKPKHTKWHNLVRSLSCAQPVIDQNFIMWHMTENSKKPNNGLTHFPVTLDSLCPNLLCKNRKNFFKKRIQRNPYIIIILEAAYMTLGSSL